MVKLTLAFFMWVLIAVEVRTVLAGTCWSAQTKNGFCQGFVRDGVSMTECCKLSLGQAGFTDRDISSSGKFLYYMFISPPPCRPCFQESSKKPKLTAVARKDPCKGIYCGKHRECKLDIFHQPRCVCTPKCTKAFRGEVCGTNSKTYLNECEMLRSRCKLNQDVKVDYYHMCRTSCKNVLCPGGKQCIVDQYKVPHCVTMVCPLQCPKGNITTLVCGTDGTTYESICHMRRQACLTGKAAGVAYHGKCRETSCATHLCPKHKKCLTTTDKRIRCVSCKTFCFEGLHIFRPVCGSNGITYENWCMLRQASCDTGMLIEVAYKGGCKAVVL